MLEDRVAAAIAECADILEYEHGGEAVGAHELVDDRHKGVELAAALLPWDFGPYQAAHGLDVDADLAGGRLDAVPLAQEPQDAGVAVVALLSAQLLNVLAVPTAS